MSRTRVTNSKVRTRFKLLPTQRTDASKDVIKIIQYKLKLNDIAFATSLRFMYEMVKTKLTVLRGILKLLNTLRLCGHETTF